MSKQLEFDFSEEKPFVPQPKSEFQLFREKLQEFQENIFRVEGVVEFLNKKVQESKDRVIEIKVKVKIEKDKDAKTKLIGALNEAEEESALLIVQQNKVLKILKELKSEHKRLSKEYDVASTAALKEAAKERKFKDLQAKIERDKQKLQGQTDELEKKQTSLSKKEEKLENLMKEKSKSQSKKLEFDSNIDDIINNTTVSKKEKVTLKTMPVKNEKASTSKIEVYDICDVEEEIELD